MSDPSGAWQSSNSWRSAAASPSGAPSPSGWRGRSNNEGGGRSYGSGNRGGRQQDGADDGRRIYLGNLAYQATASDVKAFVAEHGFAAVQSVHVATDGFSGRNPGYGFVEFADKEAAEQAIAALEGQPMFDRPVKCRPCQPRGAPREPREPREPRGDRWAGGPQEGGGGSGGGRWARPEGGFGGGGGGRSAANTKAQEEGRQLHVGGLPQLLDPVENESEMRALFQGFDL